MGVSDLLWDNMDKIKVNVVGGRTPDQGKPGPSGIYKDGKLVWSPEGEMVRTFKTGATRSSNDDKVDFRGFLSPIALRSYAEYMHRCRLQPDGANRDSDNWKKGIPLQSYMESMWRHFFAVWEGHEAGEVNEDDLDALFFNVQGYLHEWIKERENNAVVSGLRRSFGGL